MKTWNHWVIAGWALLTVLVVAYELWCNFNGSPKTPTLTDVTIRYMPWWITLPFLAWLLLHFAINYVYVSRLLRAVIQ